MLLEKNMESAACVKCLGIATTRIEYCNGKSRILTLRDMTIIFINKNLSALEKVATFFRFYTKVKDRH